MILNDNLNILNQSFSFLYEQIKAYQSSNSAENVEMLTTRSGISTLCYKTAEAQIYIHSKYNPLDEASKLFEKYSDMSRYKHVFFFGIGLGYHIEAFILKYPDMSVSLYEPDKEIFSKFIAVKPLKQLLKGRVASIYAGKEQNEIYAAASHFVNMINGEVLFVSLPSYERLFGSIYKSFLEAFRTSLVNKRASLQAQTHFQKLWTTNSIRNFKEVINSSNILQDKKMHFAGKPAIIAAAGPSLEDELENLRLIRAKGLAYVFSAGSAINTLLSNGIYPHAVCTYDPAPHNYVAMKGFIEKNRCIPLIFGSSTYYKVVEQFSGRKYHVISDKDTAAQFYLKNKSGKKPEAILDSPSITIMLLQLLVKLECNPIILLGQNFAYKNNKYYARGIEYDARPAELSEEELKNAVVVADVYGGSVYTNNTFDHMRRQMEDYIRYFNITNVINCTSGGARIEGTTYKPLKELIDKSMSASTTIEDWASENDSSYDFSYITAQNNIMLSAYDSLYIIIDNITGIIDELDSLSKEGSDKVILKSLSSFEKELNAMLSNCFFDIVIKPMNRVQIDIINRNLDDIRAEMNIRAKAKMVVEYFGSFIKGCKNDFMDITSAFYENSEYILDNDIKVLSFTVQIA